MDFPNAHLKVFNRWGNLVYEMKQYGNSPGGNGFWDGKVNRGLGTANGDVPTGTYFYILDLGVNSKQLSGYIYIDR